jgi:hypothetical protein
VPGAPPDSGGAGAPFSGFDLTGFACAPARDQERRYGAGWCGPQPAADAGTTREEPSVADGPSAAFEGARVRYWDASPLINCRSPLSGGGAHSDIYRAEFGRFLWHEIGGPAPSGSLSRRPAVTRRTPASRSAG